MFMYMDIFSLFSFELTTFVGMLHRYLRYMLNSSEIRKQDIAQVVVGVANNPIGRSLAWDFIRANWIQITER